MSLIVQARDGAVNMIRKGKYKFEVVFNESTPLMYAKDFEILAVSDAAARSQCQIHFDELYKNVRGYDPGRLCITELEELSKEEKEVLEQECSDSL